MSGKGLFLDLDGTLANSLPALKEVYFSFLTSLGAKGSEEEFQRLNGPPLVQIVEALRGSHNLLGDPAKMIDLYLALTRQAHEKARPAEGAREILEHARRKRWKVAVVTSAPRSSALAWLARHSLSEKVDDVVGGDEVIRGKPDPAPYALALLRVNCEVAASLAVEDSPIGAHSAIAAGLSTCALAVSCDKSEWPPDVTFIKALSNLMEIL